MENEYKKKEEVESSIFMEPRKPGESVNLSHGGITRKNLQSNQNEENRTAESNKKVRKHV
jgi:hypothetical protein